MTNRPNHPKDLDMSDVLADTDKMREQYIASLTEHLDPCDLLTVCALIIDAFYEGSEDRVREFLASDLAHELIVSTQSNPDGVSHALDQALHAAFQTI